MGKERRKREGKKRWRDGAMGRESKEEKKKGKRNEKEVGRTQGTENISTSCLGNRCPKAQPQIGGR